MKSLATTDEKRGFARGPTLAIDCLRMRHSHFRRGRDDEPTLKLAVERPKETVVRTQVELKLNQGERTALRSLTPEEREVVVDEMLEQVREDLSWMMALEVARGLTPPTPPMRPTERPARRRTSTK